jgi:ribosome-binding protein aMBF1 (putative translation factor)
MPAKERRTGGQHRRGGRDPGALAEEARYLAGIGRRLRLLRVWRELSQAELATQAGMSRNFVSSVERGRHAINVLGLRRLAMALGVTQAVLVDEAADATRQMPPSWSCRVIRLRVGPDVRP